MRCSTHIFSKLSGSFGEGDVVERDVVWYQVRHSDFFLGGEDVV